jgi:hypothetical protein
MVVGKRYVGCPMSEAVYYSKSEPFMVYILRLSFLSKLLRQGILDDFEFHKMYAFFCLRDSRDGDLHADHVYYASDG